MKTKHILLTVFSVIAFTACELDFPPTDSLSNETVTKDDLAALLAGVYDGAQSSSMGLKFIADDMAADNLNSRGWFIPIDICETPTDNSYMKNWWNEYYRAIERCNNLNLIVDNSGDSSPEFIQSKAQSCFIRAWCYIRLTSLWGPVPVVTVRTTDPTPRNSEVEVWTQIKNDLEFAEANAPDYTTPTYISKTAAKALLARVYLIAPEGVRDLAKAASYAEELIGNSNFELADDYSDIWWKKSSKEMIMHWNNIVGDASSAGWFLRSNLVFDHDYVGLGRYDLPVDQGLFNIYEPGDKRKESSVRYLKDASGNETWDCVKFPSSNADDPFPVVRIAEMYLVSAEAKGYPAGVTRLNELRVKRGLPALKEGVDITADNFMYKIMAERRVELAFEMHRYYDLRRWFYSGEQGKRDVLSFRTYQPGETAGSRPTASEKMNLDDDGDRLLLPISASAIAYNPALAPNNPGY